jgi:hypothetical protein
MERLPKSIDYSSPMATLPPETNNYLVSCAPSNGSTFGPGTTIIVDLNNVGYLDPASLSIRYKYTATSASNTASGSSGNYGIVGCPLYTPILRLDVLSNSSVLESINNYNSVATMLSNVGMNISDKMGQQFSLGYSTTAGDTTLLNPNTDGVILGSFASSASYAATAVSSYVSGPLIGCSLAYAEKLIPLDYVSWRLQFTLDAVANIGSNLSTDIALSNFIISNFEVVYNQVQFPAYVNQQIKMASPRIKIKTKSFAVGSQPITAGSTGTINLYYNLRYASIRSLFLSCGPSLNTLSASKLMEAVDPTGANGSVQWQVGGVCIPQNAISTLNNRAAVTNELRRAMDSIYSKSNSMAIAASEFLATHASTTTIYQPGKAYFGTNCMRFTESQDYMFTGISSTNSQINVIINTGTAVTASNNLTALLIVNYDAIFDLDVNTKQLNYIQ